VNCCLHVGHEQSGRHSLSGYICDAKRGFGFAELQHVEIVAANRASRSPGTSDFAALDLGDFVWQQPALNTARFN
jgi:hypothetical protein